MHMLEDVLNYLEWDGNHNGQSLLLTSIQRIRTPSPSCPVWLMENGMLPPVLPNIGRNLQCTMFGYILHQGTIFSRNPDHYFIVIKWAEYHSRGNWMDGIGLGRSGKP